MPVGKKIFALLLLPILTASLMQCLQGQEPAPQSEGFKIGVEVDMVAVPVTVRKTNGEFIKKLPQSAFRVREDDKPQEITFFAQEALPVNVAILLDNSLSVQPEWGPIKNSTRRFIENLQAEDRFSLVSFNTETRLKMDWGRKTDKLDLVLSSITCKDNTKLWNALWTVSTDVFKGVEGKKAIIIMSDGMDTGSDVSYMDALEAAVRSEAAIYIVSKTEAIHQYYDYLGEKIPPEEFFRADAALRKLAHDTGGRVLYPNSFGQLDNIYAQVTEELRNQYTLGYSSSNPLKDGSYRNISVGVALKDVTITARPGYYAPNR
jgi:Ca-activated chloride channel homolog